MVYIILDSRLQKRSTPATALNDKWLLAIQLNLTADTVNTNPLIKSG